MTTQRNFAEELHNKFIEICQKIHEKKYDLPIEGADFDEMILVAAYMVGKEEIVDSEKSAIQQLEMIGKLEKETRWMMELRPISRSQ